MNSRQGENVRKCRGVKITLYTVYLCLMTFKLKAVFFQSVFKKEISKAESVYVKELVEKCLVSVTHEIHAPLCLNEGT